MRKKRIWALLIVTFACSIGFAAYLVYTRQISDNTPPEISFLSDVLEVSVEASEDDLLVGVTAQDSKDGNVTNSVLVEGISGLSSDQLATITYAAFDQAGNVAKAQRTVQYTDYQSPRFSLSAPLVFRSGSAFNLLNYIGAEDVIDGVLNDRIKATLVSTESALSEEGTHEVEFRVTNSMKDTVYLTVPVDIYPAGMYNATITLSDYLVYVEQGSRFDYLDYLESFQKGTETIFLGDSSSDVSVSCDSDVNTNVPGTYSVTYTAKSGSYTGYTRLIVVVEE